MHSPADRGVAGTTAAAYRRAAEHSPSSKSDVVAEVYMSLCIGSYASSIIVALASGSARPSFTW
jgi:hypothetical protein